MAKAPLNFVCQNCGAASSKWSGRCEACGEWNTIQEEKPLSEGPKSKTLSGRGRSIALSDLATKEPPPPRTACKLDELDRVLGGGLVPATFCA